MKYRIASLVLLLAAIAPAQEGDSRPRIDATGYFGIALDSFASGELNKYVNPDQDAKVKERAIGGVSFEFRLLGDPAAKKADPWKKRTQLWLFGETVHGVRSAGVDCTADEPASGTKGVGICAQFDPTQPNRTFAIIRNSTSLEAFVGARWEFKQFMLKDSLQAALYAKGQAGFITVAGLGGDVVDSHHGALGIITTAGQFAGSYLEVGLGKTDLYPTHTAPRLKIDGYLQFPLPDSWVNHGLHGFAQMTVDSNWSRGGADSIQSYFGITFDMGKLLR
jgi:hypothetical protein